jgi:hypothetical protein
MDQGNRCFTATVQNGQVEVAGLAVRLSVGAESGCDWSLLSRDGC